MAVLAVVAVLGKSRIQLWFDLSQFLQSAVSYLNVVAVAAVVAAVAAALRAASLGRRT